MSSADPIPSDRPHVIPYLTVKGAADAIEWYVNVFDATEDLRMPSPDGRLMHAEINIAGSLIYISDDFPEMTGHECSPSAVGATTVAFHRYVADCDALVARAVDAGAEVLMEPTDMFWGDRYSRIRDPFGHEWSIATHVRDVTPEEMEAEGAAMFANPDP